MADGQADNGKPTGVLFGIAGGGGMVSMADANDTQSYCYMTISGGGLDQAVVGRAPMTGVKIEDELDMQINKTLSGDLIAAAFGYKPVGITIDGIDFFVDPCGSSGGAGIVDAFNGVDIVRNPAVRIDVVVTEGSRTYKCIAMGLTLSNEAKVVDRSGAYLGAAQYTMRLIGVKTG